MPCAVAFIGGSHQDYRHRRGQGGQLPPEYDALTSNLPFVAMLSGAQGPVADVFAALASELKQSNALIGASVALLWTLRLAVR